MGGHADGLWNYREIQPQGWALLQPVTSKSKKKNRGTELLTSQPCELAQVPACHCSARWLWGLFVPSWDMGAGVQLGSLPKGILAEGNSGTSQLDTRMSPSTSAFRTRSDPSGTTKPLFEQGVGPGPDTGVAAQGLLWRQAWP